MRCQCGGRVKDDTCVVCGKSHFYQENVVDTTWAGSRSSKVKRKVDQKDLPPKFPLLELVRLLKLQTEWVKQVKGVDIGNALRDFMCAFMNHKVPRTEIVLVTQKNCLAFLFIGTLLARAAFTMGEVADWPLEGMPYYFYPDCQDFLAFQEVAYLSTSAITGQLNRILPLVPFNIPDLPVYPIAIKILNRLNIDEECITEVITIFDLTFKSRDDKNRFLGLRIAAACVIVAKTFSFEEPFYYRQGMLNDPTDPAYRGEYLRTAKALMKKVQSGQLASRNYRKASGSQAGPQSKSIMRESQFGSSLIYQNLMPKESLESLANEDPLGLLRPSLELVKPEHPQERSRKPGDTIETFPEGAPFSKEYAVILDKVAMIMGSTPSDLNQSVCKVERRLQIQLKKQFKQDEIREWANAFKNP
jgi:hypothetical protein